MIGQTPSFGIQCDLSFGALLQKLSDVVDMLGCVTIVSGDFINNLPVTHESGEGCVVVMLRYRGHVIRSMQGCTSISRMA